MPKIIISNNKLEIIRDTKFFKIIGVSIIVFSTLFLIIFLIIYPHRLGQSLISILLSLFIVGFLLYGSIRAVKFLIIDKNSTFLKLPPKVYFNDAEYNLEEMKEIYVIKYGNYLIRDNCNVYIVMCNGSKITVSIKIGEKDLEKVVKALTSFLNIDQVVIKSRILNW